MSFLKTSDGEVFEIEEKVVMEFHTVEAFFQDDGVSRDLVMPIPNVHSRELVKIINFCGTTLDFKRKGEHDEAVKKKLRRFYKDFVKDEKTEQVMELILAADYLDVDVLLDLLFQCVADRIQNKSVEYVRKPFGIDSDWMLERRKEIRDDISMLYLLKVLMRTDIKIGQCVHYHIHFMVELRVRVNFYGVKKRKIGTFHVK